MDATNAKPPKAPTGKITRAKRWSSVLLGTALSSLPAKYIDFGDKSSSSETPDLAPRKLSASEYQLQSQSTESLISRFFDTSALVSDALAWAPDGVSLEFPCYSTEWDGSGNCCPGGWYGGPARCCVTPVHTSSGECCNDNQDLVNDECKTRCDIAYPGSPGRADNGECCTGQQELIGGQCLDTCDDPFGTSARYGNGQSVTGYTEKNSSAIGSCSDYNTTAQCNNGTWTPAVTKLYDHCNDLPPTPDPVDPTPDPVDPTPDPVDPTPDPVDPTPDPVDPTPEPKCDYNGQPYDVGDSLSGYSVGMAAYPGQCATAYGEPLCYDDGVGGTYWYPDPQYYPSPSCREACDYNGIYIMDGQPGPTMYKDYQAKSLAECVSTVIGCDNGQLTGETDYQWTYCEVIDSSPSPSPTPTPTPTCTYNGINYEVNDGPSGNFYEKSEALLPNEHCTTVIPTCTGKDIWSNDPNMLVSSCEEGCSYFGGFYKLGDALPPTPTWYSNYVPDPGKTCADMVVAPTCTSDGSFQPPAAYTYCTDTTPTPSPTPYCSTYEWGVPPEEDPKTCYCRYSDGRSKAWPDSSKCEPTTEPYCIDYKWGDEWGEGDLQADICYCKNSEGKFAAQPDDSKCEQCDYSQGTRWGYQWWNDERLAGPDDYDCYCKSTHKDSDGKEKLILQNDSFCRPTCGEPYKWGDQWWTEDSIPGGQEGICYCKNSEDKLEAQPNTSKCEECDYSQGYRWGYKWWNDEMLAGPDDYNCYCKSTHKDSEGKETLILQDDSFCRPTCGAPYKWGDQWWTEDSIPGGQDGTCYCKNSDDELEVRDASLCEGDSYGDCYGDGYGDEGIIDGWRLPEPPLVKAQPIDPRYRDMCVSTAPLGQGDFDSQTGLVKFSGGKSLDTDDLDAMTAVHKAPCKEWNGYGYDDVECPEYPYYEYGYDSYDYEDGIPEAISPFHEKFVGRVAGAKPVIGSCMAMKNTGLVDTMGGSDPNNIFAYYLNLDNNRASVIYHSNGYRDTTEFLDSGGTQGCPPIEMPKSMTSTKAERKNAAMFAYMNWLRASYCYDYYILEHAKKPWRILEKPGFQTDDPLSQYDADRTFLSSCQPLIKGNAAKWVQYPLDPYDPYFDQKDPRVGEEKRDKSGNEKAYGFAPVLRYWDNPVWDEAEYHLGNDVLKYSWRQRVEDAGNLIYWKGIKSSDDADFSNVSLPCIQDQGGFGEEGTIIDPTTWYPGKCENKEAQPKKRCDDFTGFEVDPLSYQSPAVTGPKYCPNVEKINDPNNPFSPRDVIGGDTDRDASYQTGHYECVGWNDPTKVSNCGSCDGNGNPQGGNCNRCAWGYLGHKTKGPKIKMDFSKKLKDQDVWHVTCAVVPVDILPWRRDAFNQCISDRINFNFMLWKSNPLTPGLPPEYIPFVGGGQDMANDSGDPKDKPWYRCKTRYWENDDWGTCPVPLSIQQCCRILVKDVVPANFLKIRTCEGKVEAIQKDKEIQRIFAGTDEDYYPTEDESYAYDDECRDPYEVRKVVKRKTLTDLNPYHLDDPLVFTGDIKVHIKAFKVYNRMKEIPCTGATPQGYSFTDYFPEGNMPYMRWWDTGVAAGNPYHGGQFTNTLGMNDVIIGVGREERSQRDAKRACQDAYDAKKKPRGDRLKGAQPSEQGRFGGWSELKAHQMQTERRYNMACLGRYEKLFKQGAAENFVLSKAGAGYTARDGRQWPWPLGWRGYVTAGSFGGGNTQTSTTTTTSTASTGSVASNAVQNPNSYGVGLDHALPGDIIFVNMSGTQQTYYVLDIGFGPDKNRSRAVFDFNIGKFRLGGAGGQIMIPDRIYVMGWDQGKYPTSTGTSVSWGMGIERTIYKKKVPDNYSRTICSYSMAALTDEPLDYGEYAPPEDNSEPSCKNSFVGNGLTSKECEEKKCQPSCVDTDISACVLPLNGTKNGWDAATIYRPSINVRPCPGTITGQDHGDDFRLDHTYSWTAYGSGGRNPTDLQVIYAGHTNEVDSDLWGWCVNAGYDPPAHYMRDYKGPQAGEMTDQTLCGPKWGQCSAASSKTRFFPRSWYVFKDKSAN